MAQSSKRLRESPFAKDTAPGRKWEASERRVSRFSGMTPENKEPGLPVWGGNTPSRSPKSPLSKKVSPHSSAAVLEHESEEEESANDDSGDYRATFARNERRIRRKYTISAGPEEVVMKMDEIIRDKIAEGLGLRSKREGIENSF